MKNKKSAGIISYLALALLLFLLMTWLTGGFNASRLTYSQVVTLFREERVQSFTMKDDTVSLTLKDLDEHGKNITVSTTVDTDMLREELGPLFQEQNRNGVLEVYSILPDSEQGVIMKAVPYLLAGLVLLFVWAFLNARAAQNTGMNGFTRARTGNGSKDQVTFSDVAGCEEEKFELQEVVEFLRNPAKFREMGAKIPRGILLVGPPGTGKTLLARAAAGEAGVSFLTISGSDFVELYVGVGASRVRDLFNQAKKVAPAIIFIDEIDAVGRKRGAGMGGGHDEKEQTLNQLLVEMDGFEKNDGVIVLAATNRADILDPALLRPGRFDRQVYVAPPDANGREEILKIHARNKRLDGDVDLKVIALGTAGFTGADLQNLLNEAAILAVRGGRPAINMDDMNEAMMKVLAGPQKRTRKQLQRDLKMTAIHEAGHAVSAYRLPTADPVHQITIVPRGRSLGMTVHLPSEESFNRSRNEMFEDIVCLLGGRVAEELFCGDITTGASNDLKRATAIARDMVARFGMSDVVGAVAYENDDEIFVGRNYERTKAFSEETAALLDRETKAVVDRAYAKCKSILQADGEKLMQVADFLLAHETMSGKQFRACMEGGPIETEEKIDIFADVKENL